MKALLQQYGKWNKLALKALWLIAAIGLIASLPLITNRIEMESSSNKVEIVFDYRDLLDMSVYKTDPQSYVKEQLGQLKAAGVGAMAVYESTLPELETSGGIKLYSAEDAALLNGNDDIQLSNRTYVLFANNAAAAALEPVIVDGFKLVGVSVEPWAYNGKKGLSIDLGKREAEIVPLDPDPIQLALLKEQGFRLSVRLFDARPYDQDRMDALLGRLKEAGVESIIFAGKQVTGYTDDADKLSLAGMAELLKKHDLLVGVIEGPIARQQKGMGKLAYLSGYQTVRLHSISEEEAFNDPKVLADRIELAVKDRNFRMIYLNARMKVDLEQGQVTTPLKNLTDSLVDPDFGAIKRIEDLGFTMGSPEPFKQTEPGWESIMKLIVMIGAVALIARMSGYFLPRLALLAFVLGLLGTAALYVLSSTLTVQALALLAAVSSPTAAVIIAIRSARARASGGSALAAFGYSLGLFVRTLLLSLVGAMFTVGLLNNISYIFVLNQFRGVSVLHFMPIGLVAIYVMFFYGAETFNQVLMNVKRFLLLNIKVIWVAAAGIGGVVMLYYLSRTGNSGTVLPIDRAFRALLENTFGVRPRTKELITHPLFIMGIFMFVRYARHRAALALVVIGTMGMLSVVDTFAHLHTPLWVSSLRVLYGAIVSLVIALVYFAAWQLLVRGWTRWRNVIWQPQE